MLYAAGHCRGGPKTIALVGKLYGGGDYAPAALTNWGHLPWNVYLFHPLTANGSGSMDMLRTEIFVGLVVRTRSSGYLQRLAFLVLRGRLTGA